MEVIRKFIDSNNLMSILALPENFRNRKLEIIVLPVEESASAESSEDISSIIQSLVGAIPYTDQSLEELREERLEKYETAD